MVDFYRLTVHLQLCVHLRQECCSGRQVDGIVIVIRVEHEVFIQRTFEVHEVLAIQCNVRQRTVVGFVLDIDIHLVVGCSNTILRLYMQHIAVLATFLQVGTDNRHFLEAVVGGIIHVYLARLE